METVPKRPATIRDVARQAGVGVGTVSRVINGSPSVSDATRKAVLAAIEELNFVPNPSARRLSLGKTLTISVIVPFFTRPSAMERLRGVENTLVESDYDLIIYNVETVSRRDACFRDIPRQERTDGVLIISLSPRDEDIPFLAQADVPIVLVDANHPSLGGLNRVVVDDVGGGKMATEHLIELGHRRIGYLSDRLETPFNFTSSLYRFHGYRQALKQAGITFEPGWHAQGDHGVVAAQHLAETMLQQPDRPTAIFSASDTQAMGVLEAARQLGLRVPADLSVVGYDDIEVAGYLELTTVHQKLYKSGRRGVELLLQDLAGQLPEPVCEVLPTELMVRQTSAPPPVNYLHS